MADEISSSGACSITPDFVVQWPFAADRKNFENLHKPLVDAWVLYDNFGEEPLLLNRGERSMNPKAIEQARNPLLAAALPLFVVHGAVPRSSPERNNAALVTVVDGEIARIYPKRDANGKQASK